MTVIELGDEGYTSLGNATATVLIDGINNLSSKLPRSEGDALTVDKVSAEAGLKRTATQNALNALIADKKVIKTGTGIKGDPHKYWCPVATQADSANAAVGCAAQSETPAESLQMRSAATSTIGAAAPEAGEGQRAAAQALDTQ